MQTKINADEMINLIAPLPRDKFYCNGTVCEIYEKDAKHISTLNITDHDVKPRFL